MVAATHIRFALVIIMVLVLMEPGGKLHVPEIPVVGVHGFVIHVPDDRVGDPRLHPDNQILTIYRTVHPVLTERFKRHDDHVFSIFMTRYGRRVARHRRFDESMRGEPDLELSHFRGSRRWNHVVSLHVPGVVPADHGYLPPLPQDRRPAAASGAIVSLDANHLFGRGFRVEVNGSGIPSHFSSRPIQLRAVVLAHRTFPAGPGILDGFQVRDAHRRCRGLQNAPGVLGGRRLDDQSQHCKKRH